MPPAEPSIFIVDDDEAVRDALCELFVSEGMGAQAFDSAEAFFAAGLATARGCLVLDIHMPGQTGLELQAELKRQGAAIPIIIITGQGDVPKARSAFKVGAVDFIEKPFDPAALVRTVREALETEGRLRLAIAEIEEKRARISHLSTREREVMDLVVAGHPNKVIATKLGLSVRTVENHRAKVMEKTKCSNLSALVSMALQLRTPEP